MTTILIIDDNARYRASLMMMLRTERYVIFEAENGEAGLEMIHQYAPDIILCDVEMPVMDGIEVLRRAKSDTIIAKIPFIMITGNSDAAISKAAHDLGVEAFLKKTVPVNQLLRTIADFLNPQVPV